MFSAKNYGLPKELIEAAKRVHEKQLEENIVTEEELAEAFAIFLEENFHVEMLTKEDIDYVFENEFYNQLDERTWGQALRGVSREQAAVENDFKGIGTPVERSGRNRLVSTALSRKSPSQIAQKGAIQRLQRAAAGKNGPEQKVFSADMSQPANQQVKVRRNTSMENLVNRLKNTRKREIASGFGGEEQAAQAAKASQAAKAVQAARAAQNLKIGVSRMPGSLDDDGAMYKRPAPTPASPERASQRIGARALAPPPRPEGRPSGLSGAKAPAVGVSPDEDALIKRAKTNAMTGGLGDGDSAFSAARKRQTATPGNQVSAKPAASARKSAPKIDYKTPVTRRGPDGTYGLTSKGRKYVARKEAQERKKPFSASKFFSQMQRDGN